MATMATITTFLLILILTLTTTTTIHARESQFFAKVSNNINNNPQESLPLNTNQQDPKFVPLSQDTGSYGLYGHDSGQLPPSATTNNLPTTTNNNNFNNNNNNFNNNNYLPANLPENYNPVAYTTPIHSSTQDIPQEFNEPQSYEYNGESKMYNSEKQDEFNGDGENMYYPEKQEMGTNGGNMYNSEKQGMSDTRFMENGKYYYNGDNGYKSQKQGFEDTKFMETEDNGNMYNNQKLQGENEMYNSKKKGMGEERYTPTNDGNMYNPDKQGMSDTRFLENGKYYYDLNMENNLNANANMNSRGVRNGYETQGYYGNNENSYDRYNTNGGSQNQEFQEFNP